MKESDGIENGVRWEIGVAVVRFRSFSHYDIKIYEKDVMHRIWFKSVKQISRYGFSPLYGEWPGLSLDFTHFHTINKCAKNI